jgi:hypothetical protein
MDEYIDSLRSLHAAMSDYLLLVGEPCPLLGQLCMRLVEIIGCLPPGNEPQTDNLDKLTSLILEAAILGVINRLEELQPKSEPCLRSAKDCMKITGTLNTHDRCGVFFKVLGIAIAGLQEITGSEYPQLSDGSGKKLRGTQ